MTLDKLGLDIQKELKEVEKSKLGSKLSKSVLNVIRTTMRNNIELTSIADNKANVLLSLNALMLTFMVPIILPHVEEIEKYHLVYPLVILIATSLATIYMAAMVLKPSKFFENQKELNKGRYVSPFFFGNFFQMEKNEFANYIKDAVSDEDLVRRHITEDLFFIGSRLGKKMLLIRKAFSIFMGGFTAAIVLSVIMIIIHR